MEQILLCGMSALEYNIVCGPSPAEQYAGDILSSYIEKITGKKMVGGKGVIDLHIEEKTGGQVYYKGKEVVLFVMELLLKGYTLI